MKSESVTATISPYAPAIFVDPVTRSGIVTHSDYKLVSDLNPARPLEILTIYLTGVGNVSDPPASGVGAPVSPLSIARVTPVVRLGSATLEVLFAGLTPGFVGLAQINVKMPGMLPFNLPWGLLVVEFGNAGSQFDVRLPIRY